MPKGDDGKGRAGWQGDPEGRNWSVRDGGRSKVFLFNNKIVNTNSEEGGNGRGKIY